MIRLLLSSLILMNTGEGGSNGGGAAGGDGGGGNGAGGAPASGAGAPPVGGQGTSNPWFSGFTDTDVKTYIETKGFKDPESLASAYRNLEKVRGVPADRLLTLPGDDKPESWNPIYDKLGRPAKAEEYGLPAKEGVPTEFLKWQADTFHKLGLSKTQAQKLSQEWNALVEHSNNTDKQARTDARNQQIQTLKSEWGINAGNLGDRVDKMVGALGLSDKEIESLEGAIGFDGFSKLMVKIQDKFGIKLDESEFHGGSGGGNDFGGMTPQAAGARRRELLSDSEYLKAWEGGDLAKRKEIDRLFAIEYSTPTP